MIVAAVIALGSAVVGCGGSGSSSSASSSSSATTSTTPTARTPAPPSASPTAAKSSTVTTGPVHASLHGASHNPKAGKLWTYTVHATDASGKPLDGIVDTDFVVPGLGVAGKETPPVHHLKNGMLKDSLTYPTAAIGHPIELVTVIHTSAGSVALSWPVTVTK